MTAREARKRKTIIRTWVSDLIDWTGSKRYDQITTADERRDLHGKFATHSSGRAMNMKRRIEQSPNIIVQ